MLSLPNPQSLLPIEVAVLAAPEPELLPAAVRPLPAFAGLLAAAAGGEPAVDGAADSAIPASESDQGEPEMPATAQAWAHVLVPELALLPAQMPPPPPVALAPPPAAPVAAPTGDKLWPPRTATGPGLAAALPAADPQRPRGWQVALPSALPSAPVSAGAEPPVSPDPVLRTITGQPIAYPAPDLPSWYDPQVPPPWFDPANPPPAWTDPTRQPATWYDPTRLPPAFMDPARIPAAWYDPSLPVARAYAAAQAAVPAVTAAVAPPVAAVASVAAVQSPAKMQLQPTPPPAPAPAAPPSPPAIAGLPLPVVPGHRQTMLPPAVEAPSARKRALVPERIDALPVLASPMVVPPPPALAAAVPAPAPASHTPVPPASTPLPAAAPDLAIASDRLGDVAVRLSGGPDQLQVVMQAQPAAAALIGAEAPRLSQDLAAAGVALAGLSVNGQRADLSGGQRDRQRQPTRREDDAPIASVRRLSGRSAARPALTIDRFA